MELRDLIDREEIRAVITRYTRLVDSDAFDGTGWEDTFTADATLDYSSAGGPVGSPESTLAWVAQMKGAFATWQHVIGQVDITLDGDAAGATAYLINPMVAANPDGSQTMLEVGGYYHHDLVRTPDGWRSRRMVDDVIWTR